MGAQEIELERELSVKLLLIRILRKWRVILLGALIGLILLGGYAGARELSTPPQHVMSDVQLEEAETRLTANLTTIRSNQEEILLLRDSLEKLEQTQADYDALMEQQFGAVTLEDMEGYLTLYDRVNSIETQIETVKKQIHTLHDDIRILQEENAELREDMKEMVSVAADVRSVLKKAILGAVGGACLVALVLFLRYALTGTLQSGEEAERRYGLPLLGSTWLPASEEAIAKHRGVDRLLDRLEGCDRVDREKQYALAAAELSVLSGGNATVLITGPVGRKALETVCSGIRAHLPADCSLEVAEDPVRHAQSVARLAGAPVVLVGEVHASRVEDMDRLMRLLLAGKAAPVGVFTI